MAESQPNTDGDTKQTAPEIVSAALEEGPQPEESYDEFMLRVAGLVIESGLDESLFWTRHPPVDLS